MNTPSKKKRHSAQDRREIPGNFTKASISTNTIRQIIIEFYIKNTLQRKQRKLSPTAIVNHITTVSQHVPVVYLTTSKVEKSAYKFHFLKGNYLHLWVGRARN